MKKKRKMTDEEQAAKEYLDSILQRANEAAEKRKNEPQKEPKPFWSKEGHLASFFGSK